MANFDKILKRPGLRQFVKFIIIGASSAVIDLGVAGQLYYRFHIDLNVAKTISFVIAVTNGFIWNSLWTFRGMGSGRRHEQYVKFFAVNIVGFLLNVTITNLVLFCVTGHFVTKQKPPVIIWLGASVTAIILVAMWNFTANKFWTFRHKPVLEAA